jgi:DNA-binding winged helix-turn-helix (wHTH) protein
VDKAIPSPGLVRFGTFEVDLRAGELRKAGVKLRLTGQPFQVLAILLETPGKLVSREELQKRLWPDTFVDVDHNLNTAINRIREVLGDSAESPRFVETLPRRGYRFVALTDLEGGSAARQESRIPWVRPRLWVGAVLAAIAVVAIAIFAFRLAVPLPPPRVSHYVQVTNDGRVKAWPGLSFARLITDGPRLYYV